MKEIKKGIVISNDIERILNGVNAFDYKYEFIPNSSLIRDVRDDFKRDMGNIFDTTIIEEDEMLEVNKFIGGEYPHCYSR